MSHPSGLWFATAVSATGPTSAACFDTVDDALGWLTTLVDDQWLTEIHAVQQPSSFAEGMVTTRPPR